MPNIASVLRAEITRIARRAVRSEVESLKKSVSTYRTEIATLKRRSQALEQELRKVQKSVPKPVPAPADDSGKGLRFSPKGLASQRRRLGLSADACGLLLGASSQSVYNWEAGTTRPRTTHLVAIGALRAMTKTQAAEAVASLKAAK